METKNYTGSQMHDILKAFCIKYRGDWKDILKAIKDKEKITDEEKEELNSSCKSGFVSILDKEYPEQFKNIYRPPFGIFYYGDIGLLKNNCLGIIGSRECSKYGAGECERFTKDLCKELTIVSGLARGIDTVAHQTTINYSGKTIAVLGSGIDNCYPLTNANLYNAMKESQLIISEYPDEVEPQKENFPFRNRLIVALSKGVLICEAKARSGTLTSLHYALETGRDVFCIPYNNDGIHVTNTIIKDGGYLVEDPDDILNMYRK